jgi:hypothetical protein
MPTLRENGGRRRKRNGGQEQEPDQEQRPVRRPPRVMFGSGLLDRARQALQGRRRNIDDEVRKAGG